MVAAGSGSRLGASVPKALVPLAGVSLVRRSVDAMATQGIEHIIVTIPEEYRQEFAAELSGTTARLVVGGARRQDSVRRGLGELADLPDDAAVLIHDAARPLVPGAVIDRVVTAVQGGAAAVIPVVPVIDSIRRVTEGGSDVVDRAPLRAVQTPQGFRLGVVVAAHEVIEEQGLEVTDDAAACEVLGHDVALVDGHRKSLKITEPSDLIVAEAIIAEEE